ncbi:hypothetical protein N9007_00475 [bacterium]|nr:hypothetical protein [Mariniblastus sp.]MDA7924264.1 hypothetical protein [Mariniblastus sp.]MDA7928501.1 hypothetical protein [Mariniblastus sp.]MDB4399542.1 hypothetical protein [bacterium]MDB4399555.1 hypothetical protein [bacterium]
MFRIASIFFVAFFISDILHAQDAVSEERAMMERLESSIQIVLKMDPATKTGQLELVDNQNESLAKLNDEYQKMIDEIQSLQGDEHAAEVSKLLFLKRMSTFQETLHTDILLPHQSDVLNSLVFSQFVKHHGGSILRAIKTYYTREFNLTDKQKRNLAKVEKQAEAKIAAAQEEFRKKLEEIANETNADVRKLLSPEQAKTLDGLQDRKQ